MRFVKHVVSVSACAAVALMSHAAIAGPKVKFEPVVTAVNAPLAMKQPKGDDRMFIVEQDGRVKILHPNGEIGAEPFLDLRSKIVTQWADFDERGLLDIAFHPDFKDNGLFYVAYTAPIDFQRDLAKQFWWDHTNVVAEYKVSADDPDTADPTTERIVSSIDWPQFNHNGHWIDFGPDGKLYIATGDGGYANDWGIGHNVTLGNGQDLATKMGKILRVNADGSVPDDNPFVDNNDAAPEIYAYGLRNPWRCSFDMKGDNALICGDVQQNSYEEVSVIEPGGNHGWRAMEATHCFDYTKPDEHPSKCDTKGMVMPILEYQNCTARPDGCKGISVTGGYVYRGKHKAWDGAYIFGDWSKSFAEMDGQIFIGTKGSDGKWKMEVAEVVGLEGKTPYILAFAQDNDGEVYALTSITTGPVGNLDTIYKIVPAN